MTPDMIAFLLLKPRPKLVGRCCQSELLVTAARQMGGAYSHHRHEGLKDAAPCTRPVWGDGRVDGDWYGLCALCWHNWCAFHGAYRLMQLNPAAAAITQSALEKLYVTRGFGRPLGLPPLPELGAALPDFIPTDWS